MPPKAPQGRRSRDTEALFDKLSYDVTGAEKAAATLPRTFGAPRTLKAVAGAGRRLRTYLIACLRRRSLVIADCVVGETGDAVSDQHHDTIELAIRAGRAPQLDEVKFWVAFLHFRAITGEGTICDRAAHTTSAQTSGTAGYTQDLRAATLTMLLPDEDLRRAGVDRAALPVLVPPPSGAKVLSLRTLASELECCQGYLRSLDRVTTRELTLQVNKTMRYIATSPSLGYYPTGTLKKTWVCHETHIALLAMVWLHPGLSHRLTLPSLLSITIIIQVLYTSGIRLLSWVDDNLRNGYISRCLKWKDVTISLVGYNAEGQPQFIVDGLVSGNKSTGRDGDKFHQDFCFASMRRSMVAEDTAFAMVLLALLSEVVEEAEDLERAIRDPEHGRRLLGSNSTGSKRFAIRATALDWAVFVTISKGGNVPKKKASAAPSTALACQPGHVAIDQVAVLRRLAALSEALTLDPIVTPSLYRRTFAMSQVQQKKAGWLVAQSMAHTSGEKGLHRLVYKADQGPTSLTTQYFGEKVTDQAVLDHLSIRGSVPLTAPAASAAKASTWTVPASTIEPGSTSQPDRPDDSDEDLVVLSAALASVVDALTEESVVGQSTQTLAKELPARLNDLFAAWEPFQEYDTCPDAQEVIEAALKVVQDADNDTNNSANEHLYLARVSAYKHPFIALEGNLARVLDWMRIGGPKACPSCLEASCLEAQHSTQAAVRKCFEAKHKQRLCDVCGDRVPLVKIGQHLEGCLASVTSRLQDPVTPHNLILSRIQGCGMPQSRLVCLFQQCQSAKTGRYLTEIPQNWRHHLSGHVFKWSPSGEVLFTNNATPNNTVPCTILGCTRVFAGSNALTAQFATLSHMVTDHELPLLSRGDSSESVRGPISCSQLSRVGPFLKMRQRDKDPEADQIYVNLNPLQPKRAVASSEGDAVTRGDPKRDRMASSERNSI